MSTQASAPSLVVRTGEGERSLAAGEAGGRQGDNLTLRGFPAGNDIYIDGVRDLGQYSRDTFNLESVEVSVTRDGVTQ